GHFGCEVSRAVNPEIKMNFERDVAVVGAGYWGKNLARNFNSLGALRTICDSSREALNEYGADYSLVIKEPDLQRVLQDPQIRNIAIATPAVTHFSIAKMCLEAGKDLFVEKPLCVRVAEAAELVRLADQHQRVLMVGHLLQYNPCNDRLKEKLGQGELGKLCY